MSLFQVTKKQDIEGYELQTMTGDIVSFTPSYSQLLPDPFSDLNVIVNVLATGGNGTPDNPNPINGYTEANITRCGVNLFDKTDIFEGYINDSNGAYSANANYKATDYIPVKGGQDYYVMTSQRGANWGAWYDSEKNYISALTNYTNKVKTAPANACYARLTIWGINEDGDVDSFGVNYPATDTTYHAYTGNTYTIAFGQTVYGGVPDVTRGKLHVTGYKVTLDGTQAILASNFGSNGYVQYRFSVIGEDAIENGYIKSSHYQTLGKGITTDYVSDYYSGGYARLLIVDSRFGSTITSAADWNTWLSNNNVDVVYELTTPFDIDITPEVISAIVGTNNVFADCGNVTVTCLI